MHYDLVPMDRSHLEGVLSIERACFGRPWSEQTFTDALYNDAVSLILGDLDEGCLEKIAVDPKYRRQGVAEELLGAFLRFGRANLAFITLEVRESNAPAIALYEKLGFRQVGRRKNYYAEVHEDAILMTVEFDRIGTV